MDRDCVQTVFFFSTHLHLRVCEGTRVSIYLYIYLSIYPSSL